MGEELGVMLHMWIDKYRPEKESFTQQQLESCDRGLSLVVRPITKEPFVLIASSASEPSLAYCIQPSSLSRRPQSMDESLLSVDGPAERKGISLGHRYY